MSPLTFEYSYTWNAKRLQKYAQMLLGEKCQKMTEMTDNERKWKKMTQWMIVIETGDWNTIEITEKKSQGLLMVKKDKKWQSVIMKEMTENDK